MSEFSSSYHIRTENPQDTLQRLRRAKISGVVFGPANGWLTFVPYENLPAYEQRGDTDFAPYLSQILGSIILHYRYGEDHGWAFMLVRPGMPPVSYACWWDPAPSEERSQLDTNAFPPVVSVEALQPLLGPFDRATAAEQEPAYRFAELLGLPAYKWLSPGLAQRHTDDFVREGGRKLGTKPRDVAERLGLPPPRQLTLPRPDLSAREALTIVTPFMARFTWPWHLASLSTYGYIGAEGRGPWRFSYRRGDSGDVIHVALMESGKLAFQGDRISGFTLSDVENPTPLPENWLDSTEIADVVGRQPRPSELTRPHLGMLQLTPRKNLALSWRALWTNLDRDCEFASWTVCIDALTRDVLFEEVGKRAHGYMIYTARRRSPDADWEDVPPPDWARAASFSDPED
jgi:hypothetical protein